MANLQEININLAYVPAPPTDVFSLSFAGSAAVFRAACMYFDMFPLPCNEICWDLGGENFLVGAILFTIRYFTYQRLKKDFRLHKFNLILPV